MAGDDGGSLLRILVSTDNHLGVWEKDEERKHDSFRAFEEVLQLAVEHNVDMLLLGGDLFHDNKPSRTTVIKAVELLNKYCLGDQPVQFRLLSDQQQNFVAGRVNYENPHLNIGLPVFTIHGNHDDPAGQDNLSAVDLLSSCGLVNYFGKVLLSGNAIGNITLSPVLLQKGETKLALYGLGNVRDERLGRLFQTPGCVRWLRPESTPDHALEDWLNIFVLHQNRVQHGAAAKNCLQERHLPAFMDLVIWGHEHECIPEPQELQQPDSEGGKAFVIQPGSSVATALSEGESRQKHVILLEVLSNQWRTIKLPLSSVRPFVWDSLTLAAAQPPLNPEDSAAITAHLERKVNSMIQQALRDGPQPAAAAAAAAAAAGAGTPSTGQAGAAAGGGAGGGLLPLVRLRVDYTGFSTINSQRFGQRFVGKVANPHDMLLWAKAPARRAKEEGARGDAAAAAAGEEAAATGLGLTTLQPDQLNQARIEELVSANLVAALDILPPEELAAALHEFVDKDEKAALANCVATVLTETQAAAMSRPRPTETGDEGGSERSGAPGPADPSLPIKDQDIASLVSMSVRMRQASKLDTLQSAGGTSSRGGATAPLQAANWAAAGGGAAGAAGAHLAGAGGVSGAWQDDLDGDLMVADGDENAAPPKAGTKRGRAGGAAAGVMPPPAPKGRGKKAAATAAAAGGLRQAGLAEAFLRGSQGAAGGGTPAGKTGSTLDGFLQGSGAQADGGVGSPVSQQKSSRSRGSAARGRGSRGPRQQGGRGSRGSKRAAAARSVDSEEEEMELVDDDEGSSDQPAAKRARGAAGSRPKRAAAAAPCTYDVIESDDDDEDTQPQPRAGRAAAAGGGRARKSQQQRRDEAEAISDDEPSAKSESIEDDDDDDDEPARGSKKASSSKGAKTAAAAARLRQGAPAAAAAAGSRRLGSSADSGAAAGGRQRGGPSTGGTGPSQSGLTGGLSGLGSVPQTLDGGYIDSSDDDDAPPAVAAAAQPAVAAAKPAGAAAGGGRRRVLPSSLGTQR